VAGTGFAGLQLVQDLVKWARITSDGVTGAEPAMDVTIWRILSGGASLRGNPEPAQ
jgi:hypothetical protein